MYNIYFNQSFNKNKLKTLLLWCLINNGQHNMINLAEELKRIGFKYATEAGISLGIDDLKTISTKKKLIQLAKNEVFNITNNFRLGNITNIDKSEQLITNWQNISEILKKNITQRFKNINRLNPIYMMAFSGARGNISQVQQLIGMRGLMADPNGQIIHLPIKSNFREGLTVTEYLISCYGARKGVVDTALRTATAGYLTRRLVDTAQHVVINQLDCGTKKGILLANLKKNDEIIFKLKDQIFGRTLSQDMVHNKKRHFAFRNQQIDNELSVLLSTYFTKIFVRSSLKCQAPNFTICQLCYGWNLSHARLVSLGEVVGVIAAQSIGEPGTQLTMRTFHTGGVFSGNIAGQMYAPFDGIVEYSSSLKGNLITISKNKTAFLVKQKGKILIYSKKNNFGVNKKNSSIHLFTIHSHYSYLTRILKPKNISNLSKKFDLLPYTILFVKNKQKVYNNQLIANFSFKSSKSNQHVEAKQLVTSPIDGEIFFENDILLQRKNLYPSIVKNKTKIWILYGKIYNTPFNIKLFPKLYDYISYKFPIAKVKIVSAFSSFLRIHLLKKDITNILYTNKYNCQLSLFNDYPFYSISLKNLKYSLLKSQIISYIRQNKNIENRKIIRLRKYLISKNEILIPYIIFANKNYFIQSYKQLESKNLVKISNFKIYKSVNVVNESKMKLFDYFSSSFYLFNNHLALFDSNLLFVKKTKKELLFINKNKINSYSLFLKNKVKLPYNLSFHHNYNIIKDNIILIKKNIFSLRILNSDNFKIFNQFGYLCNFDFFNLKIKLFNSLLQPKSSIKYKLITSNYLFKIINFKQDYYNIFYNNWIKVNINIKPIGIYNYLLKVNNNSIIKKTNNIYLTILINILLIHKFFIFKEKFQFSMKKLMIKHIVKKYSFIHEQNIIVMLFNFLQLCEFNKKLMNIKLIDKNILLLRNIVGYSYQMLANLRNYLDSKNKIIISQLNNRINLLYVFQDCKYYDRYFCIFNSLPMKYLSNSFLKSNKELLPIFPLNLNKNIYYQNKKLLIPNKLLEQKKSFLITEELLNINILQGILYLPLHFSLILLNKKVFFKNTNILFDKIFFRNKTVFIEFFPLPKSIKDFSSYNLKLQFWTKDLKYFINKFFNFTQINKSEQITIKPNLFILSHLNNVNHLFDNKMNVFKTHLIYKKALKSFYFGFYQNYFVINLKLPVSLHILIKPVKQITNFYTFQSKINCFIKKQTLSRLILEQEYSNLFVKDKNYYLPKTLFSFNSNLFNKKRVTQIINLCPYKIINTNFYVKIPLLNPIIITKNTYYNKLINNIIFYSKNPFNLCNRLTNIPYGSVNVENTKDYITKLNLPLMNYRKLFIYYNYSFMNQITKNNLMIENKLIYNKNRICFFINHLNWVSRNSTIATIMFLSPYQGEIIANKFIKYAVSQEVSNTLMILTPQDKINFSFYTSQIFKRILGVSKFTYFINKANITKLFYNVGTLFESSSEICPGKKALNSGQILLYDDSQIILRKGQPILSSIQGFFYVWDGDFITINSPIMTLFYNKLRTGDIVQGIPKIEYFFEVRKGIQDKNEHFKTNLYTKLLIFFLIFKRKSTLQRAARRSIAKIQKIIIDGVSRVYCSQGIIISRKHFEIIIKQMTSRVKIIDGGETGLLEGEFVNFYKVEKINENLMFKRVIYEPLVLGITRVSLKTESFISAASFQETTKVLSQAGLERRIDFLNGLKENVIIGRLIPAGTGLIVSILSNILKQK